MVINFSNLSEIRRSNKGRIIVLAGGCYDLIHVGHVNFLERCKKLGDILIVSTSSDVRIKERKGKARPIISDTDRAIMLSALSCVDYSMIAPDPNTENEIPTVCVIQELKPDIFATSDIRFNTYVDKLSRIGVEVRYVPDIRLESTSNIISKICKGC